MKNRLTIQGSLLGVSLSAAGLAWGQAPTAPTEPAASPPLAGEQVAPVFESVDINKDKLISKQEATTAKAMTPEAFAAADVDKDGYLSREEFEKGA